MALSSVTLAELYAAVARSSDPARNMAALAQFCAPLRVLPLDERAAAVYGHLREDVRLGPLDALLAAQALTFNLALVSGRQRLFRRVRGLDVRRWA